MQLSPFLDMNYCEMTRNHIYGVYAFVKATLTFGDVGTSHPNCLSFRLRSMNIYIYVVYFTFV